MHESTIAISETIAEPIGRVWTDEIVYLACPPDAVAARDAETGEWLPAQVTLDGAENGTAGERRLAVRLSLAPGQVRRICCTAEPAPTVLSPFTLSELEVRGTLCCIIANSRLAVAVPCSQPFNAGTVPGPMVAVRRGTDEAWAGQGCWGPAESCGRIETTLLEQGPLFTRWRTRYLLGGRELARYEMTLLADEDFVQVREATAPDTGITFRFVLSGADAPQYWCSHGGGEQVTVLHGAVDAPPPRMGLERPGAFINVDFKCGHFQASYAWAGLWRDGGPLIGVAELHGGHWHLPGRNRISVYREEAGLAWHFAVNGGTREYAFTCGAPEQYAPADGLSRFAHLHRKYGDLPLEKVRHWQLDWPLPKRDAPLLYPAGTAARWREKAAAWPELVRGYARLVAEAHGNLSVGMLLPAYLLTDEQSLRDELLKFIASDLDHSLDYALDNCYLRLIIFSGRSMKVILEAIDMLRFLGEMDEATERVYARKLAFLSYCFADEDHWCWDSVFRAQSDPRSHGGEYWDDAGSSICPPNFTTEYYTSTGLFALTYPEHPASAGWIAWATDLFERNLETMFFEGGGYEESVNYHNHNQAMMTQLAIGLLAGGHRDFFAHPRFRDNFNFFVEMLTPRVALTESGQDLFSGPTHLRPAQDGTAVFVHNWGNSGHDCSGYPIPPALAVAAGIYAERDPAYASRLMTAWRRGPQQFCSYGWSLDLLVLARPDLPDVELKLESRLMEGLGANMRAAQETRDEIFGWVKCGPATHHNCNDEGGLVLYGYGAPLLGDFGYHTEHQGHREAGFETWKHTCVTFGDTGKATSFYLGVEQALPPKVWQSTPAADLLVCHLPVEYLLLEGFGYSQPTRVPHIEHTRSILFVKSRYFVIYDQIPQTSLPSNWWLHALAHRIEVDGHHAYCHGQFGVDLDVRFLLPAAAHIETGEYSAQRHLRVTQPGAGDYLTVLTPLRKGEAAPEMQFDAAAGLLTVSGAWGEDEIVVGGELPLEYQL